MTTWFQDLMDELEKKEEERRLQMNKIRCDQVLQTISVLEARATEVSDIAAKERTIVDQWEQSETGKMQRQIDWLSQQLEAFIRSTDRKSIVLAHGSMHLRLGKPKVSVVDLDKFLPIGEKLGLIREKAPAKDVDLRLLGAYIKRVGSPHPFVTYTPASVNFYYITKGSTNEQSSEIGSNRSADQAEAIAK